MCMNYVKPLVFIAALLFCAGCTTSHHEDGWYETFCNNADGGILVGRQIVAARDFAEVRIDTVSHEDRVFICGRVSDEKRQAWADATERMIGQCICFVFNDSIITSPQVNARIESGTFQITSSDKALIVEIYHSMERW